MSDLTLCFVETEKNLQQVLFVNGGCLKSMKQETALCRVQKRVFGLSVVSSKTLKASIPAEAYPECLHDQIKLFSFSKSALSFKRSINSIDL